MNRKYLDDIGVTDRPDTWVFNDGREEKWALQRRWVDVVGRCHP